MELNFDYGDFADSLMYKSITSGRTNGIVCDSTITDHSWVKWYDDRVECYSAWIDLLNEYEASGKYDIYYPKEFVWKDGTPDPGDYALVYQDEKLVDYLHIITDFYDVDWGIIFNGLSSME